MVEEFLVDIITKKTYTAFIMADSEEEAIDIAKELNETGQISDYTEQEITETYYSVKK